MRKLLSAMVVVFSMGMTGSVQAQDTYKASEAYQNKYYVMAFKEWRLLAEKGDSNAEQWVADMYYNGQGVTQDYKEAVIWLRKVSEKGDAFAQSYLGKMYELGHGVKQDNVYAHMWFNISASHGGALYSERRDAVAKKMTSAEVDKAQELARECVKKNYKGC